MVLVLVHVLGDLGTIQLKVVDGPHVFLLPHFNRTLGLADVLPGTVLAIEALNNTKLFSGSGPLPNEERTKSVDWLRRCSIPGST